MYTNLLKLCGFEEAEIERQRNRLEKAFKVLELEAEDFKRGEKRVQEYYDLEAGTGKLLGLWIKELVNVILAREEGKKIAYYSFPTIAGLGFLLSGVEGVYSIAPEMPLSIVMGQIFDKLTPILEAGEQHGLPPGLGHCSLNQTRVGGIAKGILPLPDIALTSSFMCDQEAKNDELLHEVYGMRNVYIDNVLDSQWGEFPNYRPERVEYLGKELNLAIEEAQRVLGVEVTKKAEDASLAAYRRLWGTLAQVQTFNKGDPMVLSQVDIAGVMRWMVVGSSGMVLSQEATDAFNAAIQVCKERADKGLPGKGVAPKGSPKIIVACAATVDPSVVRMIEQCGLSIPATWMGWFWKYDPKTTYTTWGDKKAEIELKTGFFHSTYSQIVRWKEVCEDWDVDGSIWDYQFSCRPIAIYGLMLKKYVEEELGIPVLALEHDWWDTRDYSAGALRTRVETFAEMLRARKAVPVA